MTTGGIPRAVRSAALVALGSAMIHAAGAAQQAPADAEPGSGGRASVTSHEITTARGQLAYTATAGYLSLPDEDGGERARVFYVAYTRDGVDSGNRPLTFAFNGGPGQPAVWLHLGIGPMRAAVSQPSPSSRFDAADAVRPPYGELTANEHTWLTESDLVFVDPVSTGYSRAAEGVEPREFHGYEQDVRYLGEFVRLYLSRTGRWDSPKFLVGESYGTTRVSGLADHLQQRHGIYLNGVALVSSILNWQTARFHTGNDLPYLLFLPTYTATAWYHGRLTGELMSGSLEDAVRQAREFALNEYALALLQGSDLPAARKESVAARLAELTGLTPDYVMRSNLRVHGNRFTKELRRGDRVTVGRLDSRYVGVDRDAAGEFFEYDPSYFVYGPFSALFNDYVRGTLEYENDLPYEVRAGDLVRPWDYSNVENRYLNVAEELRRAMSENPSLRLFVASGYYDVATPFFAMDYTLSQMQLAEALRDNIDVRYYHAGHMMYIDPASLAKLHADITRFYAAAVR